MTMVAKSIAEVELEVIISGLPPIILVEHSPLEEVGEPPLVVTMGALLSVAISP